MAVASDQMPKREALAMLALARAASPEEVSWLEYAVGYAAILMPGGVALVRSRWLRPIRRVLSRLLHFRLPRTFDGKTGSSCAEAERGTQ